MGFVLQPFGVGMNSDVQVAVHLPAQHCLSQPRIGRVTVAATTRTILGAIIYALTVILGACLLFLVQPLIAKLILPWFGGASAVWSAALLFFQACVFGGYAYAHGLVRLRARPQVIVHTVLLLASCALLPIVPSEHWQPTGDANPTVQILLLLGATVGLPALVLSSTSPLLQVWHMRRTGSAPPYWLYSLSNFGSLIALLGFPLLLEPVFTTTTLAMLWSVTFAAFAVLSIIAGWMSLKGEVTLQEQSEPASHPPTLSQMTLWLLFSACASALLVAVTAHLSVNVAPIPLLWVVPLALYLLTFILNFGNVRVYNRATFFPWLAAALGCMTYLYMRIDTNPHIRYAIPLFLISLFVICMACHGELIQRRPAPRYLTRFYLFIALGGVLGGAFVAVLAPVLFDSYWEIPIILIAIAELAVYVQWRRRGPPVRVWLVRGAMVAGVIALATFLILTEISFRQGYLLVERNFYGVLRLREYDIGDDFERRTLFHGTISHGYQYRKEEYRDLAASYYATESGIARTVLATHARGGPVNIGVVGLGAGVLASYARPGDAMTMYEINPAVVRIADQYFDFVSRARARGADVDIVLGDARLSMERQPPQQFDVLAVDAFSSDSIPVHLLTLEAMELYARHLKPDGVLVIHISNRYVDLVPVCARAAEHLGRLAFVVEEGSDLMAHATSWVVITANAELLREAPFEGSRLNTATAHPNFRAWTDDYSNVLKVMKLSNH